MASNICDRCDDSNLRLYEEEVPQELWIEIFVRASVESLLSVKCVCTHWNVLVSNPSFAKKHLQFQKAMSKNKGCFLLKQYDYATKTSNCFLFDEASVVASAATSSSSHGNFLHSSLLNTARGGRQACIEGPVNGLYCVYGGTDRIVIWNPATEEVGFLPLAGECLPSESRSYESKIKSLVVSYISLGVIGFGTNPLNEEDYKVVLICIYEVDDMGDEVVYPLLYTSSTNSWRILDDDNLSEFGYYPYRYRSNNTYLDGFYYWLTEGGKIVLSFDMGKEIFRKIITPNIHSGCRGDLVLHNDHINLLTMNIDVCENIDVWVLNLEESTWVKKKSIGIGIGRVYGSLGFWKKDDEMLLVIDSDEQLSEHQTILYNTTTQEIRNLGPRGGYFKALVYYESLVSLRGEITKYKGNDTSSLDAIWYFLSGDTIQEILEELQL